MGVFKLDVSLTFPTRELFSSSKLSVHEQLVLQKKERKLLSQREKNRYLPRCVSPPWPSPVCKLGDSVKILWFRLALLGFYLLHLDRTVATEWQEAENERAWEMNINPISGVSSSDYKGKSFIDWGHALL
ncbi:hypothetical protein JOM56_014856 [Amanita muscaria]